MKKLGTFFCTIVIAVLIIGAFSFMPAQASSTDGKTRVMVQFQPGKRGTVEQTLKGVGAEFHYAFDNLDTFAVTIPSAAVTQSYN